MKTNSFLYYLQVEPDLFPFFYKKNLCRKYHQKDLCFECKLNVTFENQLTYFNTIE